MNTSHLPDSVMTAREAKEADGSLGVESLQLGTASGDSLSHQTCFLESEHPAPQRGTYQLTRPPAGDLSDAAEASDPGYQIGEAEVATPWELCQLAQPAVKLETTGATPHRAKPLTNEFWSKQRVFTASIAAKLREQGMRAEADSLDECHTEPTYQRCCGCKRAVAFYNHCDAQFCPMCQPALAHARKRQVEWWAANVRQPKHIVLTLKNVERLTPEYVAYAKRCMQRLRRRKLAKNWLGGLWSLEITNEGRGWHVHFHLLVDARWVDASQLAVVWSEVTGGESYIVKVKDCRNRSYLAEVTKYAVKGSQLASWDSADVAQFVKVIKGTRTFGVFGTLFKLRSQWRNHLDSLSLRKCDCGCETFQYFDANEWEALFCRPDVLSRPPPARTGADSFAQLHLLTTR